MELNGVRTNILIVIDADHTDRFAWTAAAPGSTHSMAQIEGIETLPLYPAACQPQKGDGHWKWRRILARGPFDAALRHGEKFARGPIER
jgi:hypothetical protein